MTNEKQLIKKYFLPLSKNLESQNLSNDAAIIKKSSDFVVTSDMMIEEVHFDSAINPKNLAKKILRVNLSDLASMGSSPYGYLLNIGMPNNLKEKWINDFCLGLSQDQKKYDLKLFGGDLSSSSKIFLSVTMLGKIKKKFLKSKSTAKSDIFVTGNLGDSALGYILNQKKNDLKLEKSKFIDDDRYSSTKILSLSNSGKSTNFIFNYLIKKGINKSQIQNNLNLMKQDNENWELKSAKIFAKKKKLLEKNESYEKKLAKMARAGFSYEICKKILG